MLKNIKVTEKKSLLGYFYWAQYPYLGFPLAPYQALLISLWLIYLTHERERAINLNLVNLVYLTEYIKLILHI